MYRIQTKFVKLTSMKGDVIDHSFFFSRPQSQETHFSRKSKVPRILGPRLTPIQTPRKSPSPKGGQNMRVNRASFPTLSSCWEAW